LQNNACRVERLKEREEKEIKEREEKEGRRSPRWSSNFTSYPKESWWLEIFSLFLREQNNLRPVTFFSVPSKEFKKSCHEISIKKVFLKINIM
jgi:hypothetical protein